MSGKSNGTTYGWILDRLREDILSGQLPPGTRLPIAALTARYGTSPMPIRAALRELQGQGLITMIPNRGASVRAVDATLLANVYDLRIAVLRMVYDKCALYIHNGDIEELETIQDELEQATRRGRLDEIRRLNRTFHARIAHISRNPEAADVLERNWVLIDSLRARYGYVEGQMDHANKSHRKIIAALRRRDSATAFESARKSAENSLRNFVRMIEPAA